MEPEFNSYNIVQEFEKRSEYDGHLLRWDSHLKRWENWKYLNHNNADLKGYTLKPGQKFETLTLNVLIDSYKKKAYKQNMLFSEERYRYIQKQCGELMPHVISFNEVTRTFYDLLLAENWVQQHYWVSDFSRHGFGNVIMTRVQPIFADKIQVHRLPRPIEAVFLPIKLNSTLKIYCFGSVHLIALSTNAPKRQKQFDDLIKYLKRYENCVDGFILEGDMNFHSEDQNYIYNNHQLKDAWLEKYKISENPGYTFNSEINWLINELYWGFERRKMRLDRILYMGNNFSVEDIQIVFNKPIYEKEEQEQKVKHHWFGKGSFLFVNDYFGWEMGRQGKEKYLFPSDHFGLMATIQFNNSDKKKKKQNTKS